MIEFTLNRNRNGKKSRWAKKYPRKRILKRGGEKAAGWYFHNWYDDNYHCFHGDLHKFLLKNAGRPVDKVFSEFLSRCRKSASKYNLKQTFYDMFEKKDNIGYTGGFYLTNGIINYKKRTKKPNPSYIDIGDFNRKSMPQLTPICRRCTETHTKQYLGVFHISCFGKERVYIVEKSIYDTDFYLNVKYKPCYIYGVGEGVVEDSWVDRVRYTPCMWLDDTVKKRFIFIIKAN